MTGSAPAPGEGRLGVDGHVAHLLRRAAHAVRLRLDHVLAEVDLTPPQFAVLTMISAYPGLSGADLARLTLLTPQTVSYIVSRLIAAGLLSRRPHAVHGRIRHLALTEAGIHLLALARSRVDAVERAMTAGLAPPDEAAIRAWLVALAVDGEGSPARSPSERSVHAQRG